MDTTQWIYLYIFAAFWFYVDEVIHDFMNPAAPKSILTFILNIPFGLIWPLSVVHAIKSRIAEKPEPVMFSQRRIKLEEMPPELREFLARAMKQNDQQEHKG